MEKYFEKPSAQVVRYRKRVKTYAEMFTDSGGVQRASYRCEFCNQYLFTVSVDQLSEEAEVQRMYDAWMAHLKVCPNNPYNSGN